MTVSTLPPSGLAATLPPAPWERARRAIGFALVGLALLLGAVFSLQVAHADASLLFAYGNDAAAASLLARIAFGFSLVAQVASLHDVVHTWKWRQQRGLSLTALALTLAWVACVVWLTLPAA